MTQPPINRLRHISIKGLFNRFDYEIPMKDGGITILTGPNGYGKTTILELLSRAYTGGAFPNCFKELGLTFDKESIKVTKTPPVGHLTIDPYIEYSQMHTKSIYRHYQPLDRSTLNEAISTMTRDLYDHKKINETNPEKQNGCEQFSEAYEEILCKLQLFKSIINEKLLGKKLVVEQNHTNETAFQMMIDNDRILPLEDLSDGEKRLIAMTYDLLFNIKPGTLILIDEPENSQHIVWQEAFLGDIRRIIKQNDLQIVIATHSPQIINNHWDLCIDLSEQVENRE